ncbi:MAG: efflux RND transporter periplasmic adaptor subunit [Phycisphaerales bacterium]|nr:MAG: efflux RND transporter periplasmic adaptor subunit [Phycisphaerales bacterium]
MVRWITIVVAVLGLAVGIWAVSTADKPPVEVPLAREASVNPFESGVAALGTVEPAEREVAIGTPEAGLVAEVLVHVGDRVKVGEALIRLDSRPIDADLIRARAAVLSGEAEIARWRALPRAEDLPPLEAEVERALALVKDRIDALERNRRAVESGGVTQRELEASQQSVIEAQATLDVARTTLAKARAGGWGPDLRIAEAALERQRAEVAALEALKDRLTIRSPRDGTILRRNIEPGERWSADAVSPALVLGDVSRLFVRAHVDEEDIALIVLSKEPRAVARTRGAAAASVPLSLVKIEPYARPKDQLFGNNVERVDTRVVDVVFEVKELPKGGLFVGQAVDVFVEASASHRDK